MKSTITRTLCGIGAAVSAAYLLLLMAFPAQEAYPIFWIWKLFEVMTQTDILDAGNLIGTLISGARYFIPAALFGLLMWPTIGSHPRARRIQLLASSILTLLCAVLYGITRAFYLGLFLGAVAAIVLGSFCCIVCLLLYEWLQKKLPSVFNRETVSYIVFGVLTTVVSFVSQMLFSAAGFPVLVNTVGSWVCAVLFAYIVNKLFVFESKTDTAKAFWRELGLFIGARVASLGMELVFMFVTVELLHFNEAVCKLIAQVFILIANYVFSKLVIFRKAPTDSE